MTGFHWLLLKDGRTAIGSKDGPLGPRSSWEAIEAGGGLVCIGDEQVLHSSKIREPNALRRHRQSLIKNLTREI